MHSAPAFDAQAVTRSDTVNLPAGQCRALFVGTGGDVSVLVASASGTAVVFKNVPGGSILPTRAVRVMLTNTTASDIVALY